MKTTFRLFVKGFLLSSVLFHCGISSARFLDRNGNGISDVWEFVYGATNVAANADPDGDGFSNLQEALAGTNPFDSNSYPRVSMSVAGTNVVVSMPAAAGKMYYLQSKVFPGGTNWVNETNTEPVVGTNVSFAVPMSPVMRIYRIGVNDVVSDSSGLTDWEKLKLGLEIGNPYSNGQIDTNGIPINDYDYANALITQQNVVTVAATDPVTSQPSVGQLAVDLGVITVSRSGFPLNSITVKLATGPAGPGVAVPGTDYIGLPQIVTLPAGVSFQNVSISPLANATLQAPVTATLQLKPDPSYALGGSTSASVVIYPSPGKGSGLIGQYFTNSTATYTNLTNFNLTNLFLTRLDTNVDFTWTNTTTPNLSNGAYCVRWTGFVQPQYSETYMFDVVCDDGVKLWVNDQLLIDKWVSGSAEYSNSIPLQAGVLYDIKLDYYQKSGAAQVHLNWWSPTQPKQLIPSSCLYATNNAGGSNAPSALTSPIFAVAFLGQPFSYTATAANSPLGFTARGLPPGLSFNSTNGVISGVPTLAGGFQTILTASNAVGVGASVLNISVIDTGSAVVREVWTNVPGVNITDIPLNSPPSFTNSLGTLEGTTDYGDNYAERVRGYFTAPVTGNYYFWIAGSDSAQLWISDDNEQVNQVLRASVYPTNNPAGPPTYGTGVHQWNVQPNQQSGWLSMVAGQKYFIQVLHKAGVGSGDNWSVGWLQDPIGTNTVPNSVVPGYVLGRFYQPPPSAIVGQLYTADLLADPGVSTMGIGSATLRVSADGSQAVLNFQLQNLSGVPTEQAINSDPYGAAPHQTVFDISASNPQSDGSYLWKIRATPTLSASDILQIISQGLLSIHIETSLFPNGEITGHFIAAEGTQNFVTPTNPPALVDDHTDTNAVVRFLNQATYGATPADISSVISSGYSGWIDTQFLQAPTHILPSVMANAAFDANNPFPSTYWFNNWWQTSITAPDQLRQRMAFALSEIMVVSEYGVLQDSYAHALAAYYDILLDNAFGNYRTLLQAVTLSPAMGVYLNMQHNDKGSIISGIHANENYAREIQQLFSVGLYRLWPDGTLILNSQGNLVPTYNQNVVMGFASTFTGWDFYQTNQANGHLPGGFASASNYTNNMVLVPSHHETGPKLLLDNVVLPPAVGGQLVSSNFAYDNYGLNELSKSHDNIFYNQNVGPFICRQLIQRFVTSNPSKGYLYRVTQVFNDNGSGVRGDLKAVLKAILLDYEARSPAMLSDPTFGKQREPMLRVTALARALPSPPNVTGTYVQSGTRTITITTGTPHRLNNNDTMNLNFTDISGNPAPPSQAYSVTVSSPTVFTITAPNVLLGTYIQSNNILTAAVTNHGALVSNSVYLAFTNGGAADGIYQIATVIDANHITALVADSTTRTGVCLMPKLSSVGGLVQQGSNITVTTGGPHGMNLNDLVYIDFSSSGTNGIFTVSGVPAPNQFNVVAPYSFTDTTDGLTVFPLVAPPLVRNGSVTVQANNWNIGATDTGSSSSLQQSPLRSPTVFNFFFPSYEFPGTLTASNLTTPEFQLTSDTTVGEQMNMFQGALLSTGNNNTNGLMSFVGNTGAIVLDIGPWMNTNYTSAAGMPGLIDALSMRLMAGQLSPSAKSYILQYATNTSNLSYSSPPTASQVRDRVRAVVHLLSCSPDYIIQR